MARQTITITLYKSELLYDVQNKTYLTGRSRQNGGNHEEVANMQANDDAENANQILRSLGNAFATLKTKLSEYLEESGTSANDIQMDGTENITVVLKVPSNYNHAANATVSSALHQYLVNTAIGDWFTITNKNDAADYIALAAANLEQIREAVNKRVRPTRSTPSTMTVHQITPATEPLLLSGPSDGKAFRIPLGVKASHRTLTYSGSTSQNFSYAAIMLNLDGGERLDTISTGLISDLNSWLVSHDNVGLDTLVWIANGSVDGETLTYITYSE